MAFTTPCALRCAIALSIVVGLGACGKKESPKAPPAGSPTAAVKPDLPPELGMPLDTFVAARVIDLCARKHGEDAELAERLATDVVQGKKFVMHLENVLATPATGDGAPKNGAKPAAAAAEAPAVPPAAASPAQAAVVDSPADAKARDSYRKAQPLAAAHAATAARIDAEVKECLYAPEVGRIDKAFVDRYAKAFVDIACMQHTVLDKDGKPDILAHAQAAAKIFAESGFSAGDFSRIGIVLSRFPDVQGQIHARKSARCPDPRAAQPQGVPSVAYNGTATGARNGSLQFLAQKETLRGAIVWSGLPPKPGQDNENAIHLEGRVTAKAVTLSGERGGDKVRFEGKEEPGGFGGTWKADRDNGHKIEKLSGKWQVSRISAPTAAPK